MVTVQPHEVESFLEQVENYPPGSAECKTSEQVCNEKLRDVVTALQQRYGHRPDEQVRLEISRMVRDAANRLMKIPIITPGSEANSPTLMEAIRHHAKIKEYACVILSLYFGREAWHRSKC
jgi:hypothetical protein